MACLTGALASDFCIPCVLNGAAKPCDKCVLKCLAGMLSSLYGARKIDETSFKSLLSSYSASTTKYPHSSISIPHPSYVTALSSIKIWKLTTSSASSMPNITCPAGKQYTVNQDDACDRIAVASSMTIDNFLYVNGIDFNCTTITAGMKVCIRDSCKLYVVRNRLPVGLGVLADSS